MIRNAKGETLAPGSASSESLPSDSLLQRFYPESAFGGVYDVDGTVAFYLRVNSLRRVAYPVPWRQESLELTMPRHA
jgi:hypothetical protein